MNDKIMQIHFSRIAPCLLAIIIDNLGFGLVYPILAGLFTDGSFFPIHTPQSTLSFYLGLAYLLYPLCMFFGASLLGDLSDVYGRKKIIVLCMGGLALSFFLMGLSVSLSFLPYLLLGRITSGLFSGSLPIVQASIVDQSLPQNKTINMSLMGLTLSIGLILGPFLGGILSDPLIAKPFSYSTPFYFSSILALICMFWILISFQETFRKTTKKSLNFLRPVRIFIEAFSNKRLRLLSLVFLLMQTGFGLFFTLAVVYLKLNYNYSSWQLGAFNGWIGVGFGFSMLFIARIVAKKYSAESIAAVSMYITAFSQLFFFLHLSQPWVWVLAFPIASSDMLAYTSMITSFSNTADDLSQGWVMGIATAVMAIAWVFSGLGANLLDLMGANLVVGLGGALLLISSTLMLRYIRHYAPQNVP
jgi:DHA1 family tetracycline resistance protein-like MFS transporter